MKRQIYIKLSRLQRLLNFNSYSIMLLAIRFMHRMRLRTQQIWIKEYVGGGKQPWHTQWMGWRKWCKYALYTPHDISGCPRCPYPKKKNYFKEPNKKKKDIQQVCVCISKDTDVILVKAPKNHSDNDCFENSEMWRMRFTEVIWCMCQKKHCCHMLCQKRKRCRLWRITS